MEEKDSGVQVLAQAHQPISILPQHKWIMPAAVSTLMAAATHRHVQVLPPEPWQNHPNLATLSGTLGHKREGSQYADHSLVSSIHVHTPTTQMDHVSSCLLTHGRSYTLTHLVFVPLIPGKITQILLPGQVLWAAIAYAPIIKIIS